MSCLGTCRAYRSRIHPGPCQPPARHRSDARGSAAGENLAFVHWVFPPEAIQSLLPDGLTVDTFDTGAGSRAWVLLVPFRMRRAGPSSLPPIPWISTFSAATQVVIEVGEAIEPTALDVFLTARWGAVADWGGQLRHHPVDHRPWVLHDANAVMVADSAVTACGLAPPAGEPLVRWAEPVDARFGWPVRV